eukprot:465331-Amphidinium_carterae.1
MGGDILQLTPPANTKKGKDKPTPNKPGPVPCKYFSQDNGCRFGAECSNFHPRLSSGEHRCFNCGATSHVAYGHYPDGYEMYSLQSVTKD